MKVICALLLLISIKSYAQYPFEKYPAIKYDTISFKVSDVHQQYKGISVARYKNYRIVLLDKRLKDSSNVLMYYGNKLIKRIKADNFISTCLDGPLYVSDFDKNGLIDFKITTFNISAVGLASARENKIYLFNEGHNHFSKVSFYDFMKNKERDINNKGNYEIIGQSLAFYKDHSYWIFDLYSYKNGKLMNVSNNYNYPIAVPYLNKETFKPTNKIPKQDLQKLSLQEPEYYSIN